MSMTQDMMATTAANTILVEFHGTAHSCSKLNGEPTLFIADLYVGEEVQLRPTINQPDTDNAMSALR